MAGSDCHTSPPLTNPGPPRRHLPNPKTAAVLILLALSGALLCLNQGCSLIGAGIGTTIKTTKTEYHDVKSWNLDTLRTGTEITVNRRDGSTLKGHYWGIERTSLSEYQERFARYVDNGHRPLLFPSPGDSILLHTPTGATLRRELVAYDYNALIAREPGQSEVITVGPPSFTRISWGGGTRPAPDLWNWLQAGNQPLLSSLRLSQVQGPDSLVPLNDVDFIRYGTDKRGNAAGTGFIVGLVIDIAVVSIVLVSLSDDSSSPPPSNSTTDGSCPYLYSFDGRDFTLDAEAFSGSLCRTLQETDNVALEHLNPIDGTCRIKLANRLQEIQYVDRLSLFAVDHTPEIEVIPAGRDRLHTLGDPHPPLSAFTSGGGRITSLVALKDSLFWISNPLGGIPTGDTERRRDGIVVRFSRPREACTAKLVVTLRNTSWLTELERHLLGLTGPMLGLWYGRMNLLPGSGEELRSTLLREAGLRVDLLTDSGWQARGYLPFAGPTVVRTVVLPLDLPPAESGQFEVRLESAPGLWMVDRVEVDYTEDLPLEVVPCPLSRILAGGEEVGERLEAIDGHYLRLVRGDEVELEFDSRPMLADTQRTYFASCTGYYLVDVEPRSTPQMAVLRRLGEEPGAFGDYALGLLQNWVANAPGRERN